VLQLQHDVVLRASYDALQRVGDSSLHETEVDGLVVAVVRMRLAKLFRDVSLNV
jgi:hypothetical protein